MAIVGARVGTVLLGLLACSWDAQFTLVNETTKPVEVTYVYRPYPGVNCAARLGVAGSRGLLGGGGYVAEPRSVASRDTIDVDGRHEVTVAVPAGAALLICDGMNEDFGGRPPLDRVLVRSTDGAELVKVEQAGLGAVFKPTGMFMWIWRFGG